MVIEFAKTYFLSFQVSPHSWSLPVELESPLFREGRAFKITIVVNDDYYRVLFNDQPLTGYLPRTSEVIDSFSIKLSKGNKIESYTISEIKVHTDKIHDFTVDKVQLKEELAGNKSYFRSQW